MAMEAHLTPRSCNGPAAKARISYYDFDVLSVFAGVTCFFALIQVFCLSLGIFGITLSRLLAVLILLLSITLSWIFAGRFREPIVEEWVAPPSAGRSVHFLTGIFKAFCIGALIWTLWVWIQLWILVLLRPPYDWDGLYYHLPAIHAWAEAGRISWIANAPDIPYINYPMGVETFSFFMHAIHHTSRLLNACNLWYWPLAFFALVVIATRLGARGIWRWLAGALIVGAPVFVSQSTSCYIDPAFSSTVMASVAASCVLVFNDGRSILWKAILLGASIGLMAGSKGTGLPFTLVLLVVLAGIFYHHGFKQWKLWLRYMLVCGLIIFAVSGYWYVRNAVETGNPIYPIQLKFGGNTLIEGYDHVLMNEANLPAWLERYPPATRMFVSWLQLDAPISGYAPTGGMGYIWIAGALPAFIFLWVQFIRKRKHPNCPVREFGFITVVVLWLLVLQPSSWWARFTVWLHALGLPCIAVVCYLAVSRWHMMKRHLITIVMILGIIGVSIWESHSTLRIEWKEGRNPKANEVRELFITTQQYWFPTMEDVPEFEHFFSAKKIARSHLDGVGTLFGGVLTIPLDRREIFVLPIKPEMSDIEALRKAGVEWVWWDVLSAGDVPEILSSKARAIHAYQPAPDTNFRFIRIWLHYQFEDIRIIH